MYEQRGSRWSRPSESSYFKFHAAATFQAAGGQWRHGQASLIGRFWGHCEQVVIENAELSKKC